jgi:transposase-like protein
VTDRSDDASLVEDPSSPAEELVLPAPTDPVRDARAELAAQLVDQARTEGISLVGPDGVLAEVTKLVLEAGLEVEMDEHLGYAKHAAAGRDGGNSRNGRRTKTVLTGVGPVEIMVPRDRGGTFEPVTVRKRQRRLVGWRDSFRR